MSKRKRTEEDSSDSEFECPGIHQPSTSAFHCTPPTSYTTQDSESDDETTIQEASDGEYGSDEDCGTEYDASGALPPSPSSEYLDRYFLRLEFESHLELAGPFVWDLILKFLTPEALVNMASVCCSAYILSSHDKVWKALFPHLFLSEDRRKELQPEKPMCKPDSHFWWKQEALKTYKEFELSGYEDLDIKKAMLENKFLTRSLTVSGCDKQAFHDLVSTLSRLPTSTIDTSAYVATALIPSPTLYLKTLALAHVSLRAEDVNLILASALNLEAMFFISVEKIKGKVSTTPPLPHLKKLHFHQFYANREIIYELVQRSPSLRRLSLLGTDFKEDCDPLNFGRLFSSAPQLEEFYYDNTSISQDHYKHQTNLSLKDVHALTQLHSLKALHLEGCSFHSYDKEGDGKDILEHLSKCTKLEYLAFWSCFDDHSKESEEAPVRNIKFPLLLASTIKELDLDCPITSALLSSIGSSMPHLERLVLAVKKEHKFSAKSVRDLVSGCPKITVLDIPETFLEDKFLVHLFGLCNLEELLIRAVSKGNDKRTIPAASFVGSWPRLRVLKTGVFQFSSAEECLNSLNTAFNLIVLNIQELEIWERSRNAREITAKQTKEKTMQKLVVALQAKGMFTSLRSFAYNGYTAHYEPLLQVLNPREHETNRYDGSNAYLKKE